MIVGLINDATGADLTSDFFMDLGKETLLSEARFNKEAGFLVNDDELPDFFYTDPLAPTDQVARFRASEVNKSAERWWKEQTAQA